MSNPKSEDMKLLSSYPSMADASIVQGMLEANGIQSQTQDRNNLYVPVFGGVDLYVADSDYDRAKELLHAHQDS